MSKTTFIISVTDATTGGASDSVAALDWSAQENLDSDGNVKSSFQPGEEAVFIVNNPPDHSAIDVIVHSKCGGGYIEPGTVYRSINDSAGFDSQSKETTLSYWPDNSPTVNLYTIPATTMRYDLAGRALSPVESEELPVESLINYLAKCQQVRYTPPASLSLETAEDIFPVRIEIVVEKQ